MIFAPSFNHVEFVRDINFLGKSSESLEETKMDGKNRRAMSRPMTPGMVSHENLKALVLEHPVTVLKLLFES